MDAINELEILRKDDPLYWFKKLDSITKFEQSEEMVFEAVKNFEYNGPKYLILQKVSKKFKTYELCKMAVVKNGYNLKYVPKDLIDDNLCLDAVKSNGDALYDVPKDILNSNQKEFFMESVKSNGLALRLIPEKFIDKEICELALSAPIIENGFSEYYSVFCSIPKSFLSNDIVEKYVNKYPYSIQYVDNQFISKKLLFDLVDKDSNNFRYIENAHTDLVSDELIDFLLDKDPNWIKQLPKEMINEKRVLKAITKNKKLATYSYPRKVEQYLRKNAPKFNKYPLKKLSYRSIDNSKDVSTSDDYELSLNNDNEESKVVYYISDLHLEHTINALDKNIFQLSQSINRKIGQLSQYVSKYDSLLLIPGDVADSVELEKLFYDKASSLCGSIIITLGNHELWNLGISDNVEIDNIIKEYRRNLPDNVMLLENQLYLRYKGIEDLVINEEDLITINDDDLRQLIDDSTVSIFGGIGFSGNNPFFNADTGIYQDTLSSSEDKDRTARFNKIYNKLVECAEDLKIIILTHNPVSDWKKEIYNDNWIYVNGHTHQNNMRLLKNGAVLSDNQVGYKKGKWHLNSFSLNVRKYNPLKKYSDGIHKISKELYKQYSLSLGDVVKENSTIKWPGQVFLLKKENTYMFILSWKNKLYILNGKARKLLEKDISYYYDNMSTYISNVRRLLSPYQNMISNISKEIKKIGGTGKIHGCIVDIDWYTHVYLNPFDGLLVPYSAKDITNKKLYPNLEKMLKNETTYLNPNIDSNYYELANSGSLPILSNIGKQANMITVPSILLDRDMYKPSRIMNQFQYIFSGNVIRIWNDEILTMNGKLSSNFLIE